MSAEICDFVSRYSTCQTYRPTQAREELNPHNLPSRPWEKIAADFFEMRHQTFLILVGYWSNHFEVAEIHKKTAHAVNMQFQVQFARHGIPEVVITDNGPEFAKEAFVKFATKWKFEHRTLSPLYP